MSIVNPHIEQITQELTWSLRQRALYPDADYADMAMPEDDEGTHFGAFLPNKLAGVISLFQDGEQAQFRKLAVDPALQRQGIGGHMLDYITQHAREHGVKTMWCNARTDAIEFYRKHGFCISGEPFARNGIDYVRMEKVL